MKSLKKNKKLFILTFLIICILIAIFSVSRINPTFFEKSFGYIITPIQKAVSTSSVWLEKKIDLISKMKQIEEENKTLKLEIEIKEQEIKKLKQIELENKKLLALLETSSRYNEYSKITANIIAKDPGNWYENFIIDKGEKDGVQKNMVVIAQGGLVGKIEETGANYSKVSSIINGTYSVSGKTLRTDDEGFIKGDLSNKGQYKMEYIDKEAEIKKGDEIITSHLSEIYPPGITIGYVNEVSLDKYNNLSKTAVIKPGVDFKHLEKVLIISNTQNTQN